MDNLLAPAASRAAYRGRLLELDIESWPWGNREVVRHPGAAAIVALTAQGDVVLVRQFREPVRRHLLEIPAGIMDIPGESPASCAVRELREETGYRASNVQPLLPILTSPGFADERIDVFRADAEPEGSPQEAGIEVVLMPLAAVVDAVVGGEVTDAKTVAALLLAGNARPPQPAKRAR